MALESVSNVKNVPSHFNGKNGDDDLKAAQLESSVDEVDEEDLEDGEILDDEEEAGTECPPSQVPNTAPIPADAAVAKQSKPDTTKSGESRSGGSSRRKPDDHDDARYKRDRHKHHKKRHREGDEDGPRDGKRSKRISSRKDRHSEEENDEEMMFIRGASPGCNSNSPKMQERFSQFGDSGHFEYDSENDDGSNSPNMRGDSSRGNTRRRRGSGGPRSGGRNSSDRTNNKRKDGPSSRRGVSHMDKKRECMFYSQGKCQKGDDCPYLHSICPSRKLELCKFYLMDCCAKKDKCLYMHSDFPCKFYHTGMKCFSSERCKFSHEPLTESTRQILLKHIETAPKEILGEFPRLPRDSSGEVILPEPIAQDDIPPPSQVPSGQQKKIPSLFEIEIKPPPELSNLLNESKDETMETPDDTRHAPPSRGSHRPHAMPRPGGFYHERSSPRSEEEEDEEEEDSEEDNFETQLRKCMEAQRLERERKEREEGTQEKKKTEIETLEIQLEVKQEEDVFIKEDKEVKPIQKEKTPPSVPKVKAEMKHEVVEQSEVAAKAERQRRQLEADQAEDDDEEDEDQLVMATFDEEDTDEAKTKHQPPTSSHDAVKSIGDAAFIAADNLDEDEEDNEEDESGSASEDDDVPIPKHLPKKQRELFLRIQQQQAQRAAAAAAEAADVGAAKAQGQDPGSKKHDQAEKDSDVNEEENMEELEEDLNLPARDEDWYSSDDEAEEEKTLMKNILNNLSKQPPRQGSPATDVEESMTTSDTKTKETMDSSRSHMMEQLNLSNINITDDISRLLSTIRSSTSKSETKPAPRDPRLSRDPRSRDSSGHTDAKTTTETKLADTDLRLLPSTKDLDLRKPPESSSVTDQIPVTKSSQLVDTDLRQRCYGDTDLRSVSMLGLPFKPVPLHVPCTEIDASISSHPPVQFKLIPADIKIPDYSDLKLDFSDPHVRNDPRLKKLVLLHDETISPMSPPPCEAPRIDPRSRNTSSDPRLARMTSSAVPPTTVIPVNPLVPQIPTIGQIDSATGILGGITRTQDNVLIPQISPGLNPQLGVPNLLPTRPVLLENPLNRSEAPGLLGISPMHNILIDGNMGMMNDTAMLPRQGLLGPAPPLQAMQKEDDYDSHKGYGGQGGFRGPRRGRGGGSWERRGGRGRGPRPSNWDRDRRRNRRDYDRHERSPSRHERQYSPPPRRGSRSFSPSRNDRYNSPNRDDSRRHRYSPSRDYAPQRGHSRSSGSRFSPSDSGSFTPPRRNSGSFTPPRNDSGSYTPPQ